MADPQFCTKCGKRMFEIALPGHAVTLRCAQCTPVKVQLPKSTRTTVAKVVKHFDEMPLKSNEGDTYYVETMNAVCRYDAKLEDWQILQLDQFKWDNPEDKHNNRRAAIMAQRARKKHDG